MAVPNCTGTVYLAGRMTFSHRPWQWLRGALCLKRHPMIHHSDKIPEIVFYSLASQLFHRYKILRLSICIGRDFILFFISFVKIEPLKC